SPAGLAPRVLRSPRGRGTSRRGSASSRPPDRFITSRVSGGRASQKVETPTVFAPSRSSLGLAAEPPRELTARAHAELSIHARECSLNRVLGDEERRRDLAVRVSFGHERGDSALALRQVAPRRSAAPDSAEVGAGLVRPEPRAEALEGGQRL